MSIRIKNFGNKKIAANGKICIKDTNSTSSSSSTNITALLKYALTSDTSASLDTSKINFSLASLGGSYDANNINSRYSADKQAGTEVFETVGGKTALKFDDNYYAISYNNPVSADELFDKDSDEKIWNDPIDLHNTSHTFSTWVYVTEFNNDFTITNPSSEENDMFDPVVSLYGTKLAEYLSIGRDRRPQMWYQAASSSPYYNRYKMDIQLNTNTWYNIVWTFERQTSDTSKFRIKGYVNGTFYESYYTENSIFSTHYKNIGPNNDVDDFYYDARDVPGFTGQSYLILGSRYPTSDTCNHIFYMKDVSFFTGSLSVSEVQSIHTAG